MPADSAPGDHESHRLLRILAERLNQHGMRTREYRHGREAVEIAATNPSDPDKGGHVVIGFEGYIVWEYWTPFETESDALAAADVIHVLLTQDLTARHAEADAEAPAPVPRPVPQWIRRGPGPCQNQTQLRKTRERDERHLELAAEQAASITE